MAKPKERYPPRTAAKLVYLTFDWESRKSDYRSFVEEFRDRASSNYRTAVVWAYLTAINELRMLVPPDVGGAVFLVLLRLILRN